MPVFSDDTKVLCNDAQLVERLRTLLAGQVAAEQVFCDARSCSEAPLCHWLGELQLGQAGRVQATLQEVVELLHGTRHAFKSKAVAQARNRLNELMQELSGPS